MEKELDVCSVMRSCHCDAVEGDLFRKGGKKKGASHWQKEKPPSAFQSA